MPENKPKRFQSSQGWIEENAADAVPTEASESASSALKPARLSGTRLALGAVLTVVGWMLAAMPILALNGYVRMVTDCVDSASSTCAGSTEGGNVSVAILMMVCMAAGPLFLGIAAATGKGWAWLATVLLALPVIGGVVSIFG